MDHYIRLVKDKIQSLQRQKAYCLEALSFEGLERWEAKEYQALLADHEEQLVELESRFSWLLQEA